ncbi:hypothetical protein [Streptomyces sp. NPDC059015]|uniref:hypothetical protein n=1 Tax=unclassified Streptomyces TaxID=2593676 RepID=UPI00367F9651
MTTAATGRLYALTDPRDEVVRYIGQTTKALEERLAGHLASPATKVAPWIAELKAAGLAPQISLLRDAIPAPDLLAVERAEITRRLVAGEPLLNEASTAAGRRIVRKKQEDLAKARRQAAWASVARLTREATGGPLPHGELQLIPIPRVAWDALPSVRAIEEEPDGEDFMGGLGKRMRLMDAQGRVSKLVWDVSRGAWGRFRGDNEGADARLEALASRVAEHRWESPREASRYVTLLPWALVTVAPWAALAARSGVSLEPEVFAAWVTSDGEVASSLRHLGAGHPNVFKALAAWEDQNDRTPASVHLVAQAAAEAGFEVPPEISYDVTSCLRSIARYQMLTPAMAKLLASLDPRALDDVFGPNLAAAADATLGLPEGTSAQVLRYVLESRSMGNSGTLDRVVARAAEELPSTPYPEYSTWQGRGVCAARVITVSFVRAGLLDPPEGMTAEDLLAELRELWSMDREWLGNAEYGGLYEAA